MSQNRPLYHSDPAAWERRRQKVLARDDHTCQDCGATVDDDGRQAEIHHTTPVAEGGTDDLPNLSTLCEPCHHAVHSPDDAARIRTGDRRSPSPVFTAADVAEHTDVGKAGAARILREARDEGAVKYRYTGSAIAYWFPE